MSRFSRHRGLILGALLASSCVSSRAANLPAFEPAACVVPGITPQLASRLRCGTVAVPRDRDDPSAGAFRLAVVVIQSKGKPKRTIPSSTSPVVQDRR